MRSSTLATCLALAVGPAPASAAAQGDILLGKLDDYRAAVQRDSNEATVHYQLGLAYMRDGKWNAADSALRTATILDPRLAEAYLALSQLPYMRRTQLAREEARGRVPRNWQPALEESYRLYRRAFAINPLVDLRIFSILYPVEQRGFRDYTSVESRIYELFFEGFDDLAYGRYAAAEQRFTQLARRVYFEDSKPDDVPDYILWFRGLAAAHQARVDQAIGDFQRLLDRSLKREQRADVLHVPLRTNEYRYMLAVLHHMGGRMERAVELYQEAVTNDLSLYMAHVRLAGLHDDAHRPLDAAAERQRAAQANPEDPTLQFDLALLHYQSGLLDEAEKFLQRAIELNPRDARFHYLLGVTALSLNRATDARAHLTRCVELATQKLAPLAADARQRLAGLP